VERTTWLEGKALSLIEATEWLWLRFENTWDQLTNVTILRAELEIIQPMPYETKTFYKELGGRVKSTSQGHTELAVGVIGEVAFETTLKGKRLTNTKTIFHRFIGKPFIQYTSR
jgi:hypothetical protein